MHTQFCDVPLQVLLGVIGQFEIDFVEGPMRDSYLRRYGKEEPIHVTHGWVTGSSLHYACAGIGAPCEQLFAAMKAAAKPMMIPTPPPAASPVIPPAGI